MSSRVARVASGTRTVTSKRRSPSYTSPDSRPPSPAATVSATSRTVRPRRAIAARSSFTSSAGAPPTCSALTLFGMDEEDALAEVLQVFEALPFDLEAARVFPTIPFRRGRLDRLIAAQALSRDLTIVT